MTTPIATVAAVQGAASAQAAAPARATAQGGSISFHDVLSALNPLQYLPVLGTIYRATTGDLIPEPIRRIGSLIASALLGGPIGVAINVATMAAEEVSGINLDRAGQALVHGASLQAVLASAPPANGAELHQDPPASPASAVAAAPSQFPPAVEPASALPFTVAGDADSLNALELQRIRAAYSRTASLLP